jgi:hypothetical protein
MWRDYNFHYQFNLDVLLNYFLFNFFFIIAMRHLSRVMFLFSRAWRGLPKFDGFFFGDARSVF